MTQPYSTTICSPAHPANQEPPRRHCCLDAYTKKDFILCATCYKREQPVVEDEDDYSPAGTKNPSS